MAKPDITFETLSWREYENKSAVEALDSIYARVSATSTKMRRWYWASIRAKRWTSLSIRAVAFALVILGTTFPVLSALPFADGSKLLFTQTAVICLAVAGLAMVADRVFGSSSGWMRYITTVTTMENLTRAFELEWIGYVLAKKPSFDASDVKALFDLAKNFEQELAKLQAEETTRWVVEFDAGLSLLNSLIKTQSEEAEKKRDAIRTSLISKEDAEKPGAVEVALKHAGARKSVRIALDGKVAVDFLGDVWSELGIVAGMHTLAVDIPNVASSTHVVVVKPGEVSRLDIDVP